MRKKTIILIAILMSISSYTGGSVISVSSQVVYGLASWYSETSPGINERTANMEFFDETKYTCAMWGVPFNTLIDVVNLDNGKRILVRVNDRGPARRFVREGRIIDLTKTAFSYLEDPGKGLIRVKIRIHK